METLGGRVRDNRAYIGVVIVGLAMAAYHLTSTQILLQAAKPHINTHLGFCLLLVFLGDFAAKKGSRRRFFPLVLALLALACTGYVQLLWPVLENRAYFNTPVDLAVGVILILLVLDATRRDFGIILPLLTLLVVLYPFVGKSFPEPFRCQAMDLDQTISNLGIGLDNGIYGIVLPTSANYIFLFVVFGALLQAMGGTRFFMLLAKLVAGRMQGGPGMMAVLSSSLVGSITGSAAANVAITGSFTIPLMKRVGYRPEHAAAIEAAASNGGQIMPPIMGIVAFGMAGITGIPYLTIISMALIPALLYFWAAGLYVYFRAGQLNISGIEEEKVSIKELLLAVPSFVTPFVVIIVLLVKGYSVMYVAFWAIAGSVIVAHMKKDRPSFGQVLQGFVAGARAGAGIGASAACVGLIMATVTMSGLGVKLSSGIQAWSGGVLFLGLIIIAAICVIMGCGGPSLTAYFIVSMFATPALMKMGVGFEQSHFFTMFFAVFAFLTPPVALVALIAAKLADASYIRSAIEATKAAVGGFIIPFMFIYCPVLLLQPQEPVEAVIGILGSIVCLFALEVGFVGYYLTRCSYGERILGGVAGLCLFAYFLTQNYALFIGGICLCIFLTVLQVRKKGMVRSEAVSGE
ncbi:MAG: TRAP transporter fused permease subunit [Deltaproteobacteria bacterium]|nr:TRAP transporter fused permease subunit [Deltaproteobacteria bacterium]